MIGTGINRVYPTADNALQQRIATDGLVLSQFWPAVEVRDSRQHHCAESSRWLVKARD